MGLIEQLISVLAPHTCLGCNTEGDLLCGGCRRALPVLAERCYHCRKLISNSFTCPACRKSSRLGRVRVATVYDGVAKELIWKLKFSGAQAAAGTVAQRLNELYSLVPGSIIVPVPTATSRVRRRGYDQAKLLARALARCTGLLVVDCLARSGQAHQVGASRRQRLHQLQGTFRVTKPSLTNGAHIILVDDVITTGATLEAAATVLRRAGAAYVEALAFAQP